MCAIWKGVFWTFVQASKTANSFHQLQPLRSAHFVEGRLG